MIALSKLAEDASTITLGWAPVPGCIGYRFSSEKQTRPSHTWDPARSSVKFAKGSAWYKVEALGVSDEGSYPLISTKRGVSFMRWSNGAPPPTHAVDYDLVLTSWGSALTVGVMPVSGGVYMSAVSCLDQLGWHYGVTGQDALTNGWVLKQGTRLLRNAGYPASYIGDPGDSGYQQRWASNVAALLAGWKLEVVFIDDFYGTLSLADGVPDKYPTIPEQETALLSFARYVYPYLSSRGIHVLWNSGKYVGGDPGSDNGDLTIGWWQKLAPYADCLVQEYWQWHQEIANRRSGDGIRRSGTATWMDHWEEWQRLPGVCSQLGVDFAGINYTTDPAQNRYVLASLLLETDGRHTHFWAPGAADNAMLDPWNQTYDKVLALGAPLGPKVKNGNQWERRFANGFVWVDPVAGTSAIS